MTEQRAEAGVRSSGLALPTAALALTKGACRRDRDGEHQEELPGAVDESRRLRGLGVTLGAYYLFLGSDALGVPGVLGIRGRVPNT